MTTTLATADIHASANPRDAYRWVFLEQTLPAMIAEHAVERVLVLGDLTEQKSGHSPELVNRLVDAFVAIAERAQVYILKGNHDYVAEDVPFFRYMRHLPRVRWINEPTRLRLRGLGDCLFLPHTSRIDELTSTIHEADWYFCHQTFAGADLGGRKADGASAPFPSSRGRAVSGDVHVPQKLGRVTYVGSPYAVDFGDDAEWRVLLLGDNKVRSVPVPGPQKRLVSIVGEFNERDLRVHQKIFRVVRPGDVVKVRVELSAATKASRADVRARVREWAVSEGIQLYATEIIAPKALPERAAHDRHRATDEELVRAYAKKMGQGKVTVAAGLKIVEETA